METPLSAVVTAVENGIVLLTFEDGQTLHVAATACEGHMTKGAKAHLLVVAPGGEDAGRQAIARHVLNELLKSEDA